MSSFSDEVVGTIQADWESLKQFWDPSDPILGLSDGVYDLVFLPVAIIGLGWLGWNAWSNRSASST